MVHPVLIDTDCLVMGALALLGDALQEFALLHCTSNDDDYAKDRPCSHQSSERPVNVISDEE